MRSTTTFVPQGINFIGYIVQSPFSQWTTLHHNVFASFGSKNVLYDYHDHFFEIKQIPGMCLFNQLLIIQRNKVKSIFNLTFFVFSFHCLDAHSLPVRSQGAEMC